MKYSDINQAFSDEVAGLFAAGYTIHSSTMSGSQGELAKVDFEKDGTITRVLLNDCYDAEQCTDCIALIVGTGTPTGFRDSIIWNNKLTVISERRFYRVDKGSDWFVDKDEAAHISALRYDRLVSKKYRKGHSHELSEAAKNHAARFLRRHKIAGCSRVKAADILKVRFYPGDERNTALIEILRANGKGIVTSTLNGRTRTL